MRYKQSENRNSLMLFNQIEDWVEDNNIVRFIDRFIDITLPKHENEYEKGKAAVGCKAYSPFTMCKLFLYGYLFRINSSRRLEVECGRNMEVIFLLGNLRPDFKTITDFRKDNSKLIRSITLEFRHFLKAEKFIKGDKIVYDGTKIKAYTSPNGISLNNINKHLIHLEQELETYLKQLDTNDYTETTQEHIDSLENKESELMTQIASLTEKVKSLEDQKALLEKLEVTTIFKNDSQAKFMLTRDGIKPAYNVQMGVDAANKMIAIAEVTDSEDDF